MAVCGSDGLTYDSYCDLVNFACKHQIDLVAVSLGICEQEIESSEFRDRNLRDKDNSSITIHLGSPCSLSSECIKLNAICLVNISGRGNCLCGKGTIRQGEKCVIEPTMEVEDSNSLNLHLDGKHGFVAALENLNLFMNITLTINPLSSNGVVLFAKGVYGDDFSLRLDQRRIIAEGSPLSSHSWSNLRFGRNLRNGTLSIDGVLVGSLISAPKNTHLDISGESVFLGGIPNPDFLPVKLRQLNSTFVGMVRSLSINERLFHLNEFFYVIPGLLASASGYFSKCAGSSSLAMDNQQFHPSHPPYLQQTIIQKDSHVGTITTYLQKCPTFCGQNSSSSVAHFDGLNDYIYLNRGNESKDSSNSSLFSFEFRPDSNNGIIWWETAWVGIEESDFLIVFLKNGQLNIAINLGSDSTFKSVSVKRKVTLGQWYKLEVNRRKTRVILNGELSVTVVSSPGSTELDTNGLVFIGGRGEGKSGIPVKEKFIGCIRNLSISDRFVDIIYDTVSTKEAGTCFKDE
uniref:LAM_G_DOMAIN domain-containing protein n=1 Tax=Heterorhabditis bacteriophora TaxID=37862 RepID=A0A1I7XAP1_HETBA